MACTIRIDRPINLFLAKYTETNLQQIDSHLRKTIGSCPLKAMKGRVNMFYQEQECVYLFKCNTSFLF